jgi:hypothetical protein
VSDGARKQVLPGNARTSRGLLNRGPRPVVKRWSNGGDSRPRSTARRSLALAASLSQWPSMATSGEGFRRNRTLGTP